MLVRAAGREMDLEALSEKANLVSLWGRQTMSLRVSGRSVNPHYANIAKRYTIFYQDGRRRYWIVSMPLWATVGASPDRGKGEGL